MVLGSHGLFAHVVRRHVSKQTVAKMATNLCRRNGGVNIRVVATWVDNGLNKHRKSSIAGSGHGEGEILGRRFV